MKTLLSLLLTLCLLCSAVTVLPVCALEVDTDGDTLTATNILEPINPNASQESKNLLAFLASLKDTNTFVSGAFETEPDLDLYKMVEDQFGVQLGMTSCRFFETVKADYNPNDGTYDVVEFSRVDETIAMLKAQYETGHILLFHFDGALLTWLQARTKEKYGYEDNMIVHLDATNPDRDMELYNATMVYHNKTVDILHRLEDAGVKAYLYRAFVEFCNHPFNGTNDFGKEAFVRVEQQYAQRLKESGLTGFLLTTSPNGGWYTRDWYPSNEFCDVLGVTMYSDEEYDGELSPSRQFADDDWYRLTGKPFGFTELSCRTGSYTKQAAQGRSSWYNTLTTMIQYWPEVAFTGTWGSGTYSLINHNKAGSESGGNDDGYWFVHSPYTLNLEDLPDYRTTTIKMPGVVRLYDTPNYGGNNGSAVNYDFVALEEKVYSAAQLKALGIDPADIASFHISDGYCLTLYDGDNATGDRCGYLNSTAYVTERPAGTVRSVEVSRPANILLDLAEIYASDADEDAWKANDGMSSRWQGMANDKGEGWLMVDMGRPYTINRWVVQHAGYAGMVELYNTRDFCLQISQDGENWTTVDAITDNMDSVTNRTLAQTVTARYFRLFITEANSVVAGPDVRQMTVMEWELYGVPGAEDAAPDSKPEEDSAPESSQPQDADAVESEEEEREEPTPSEDVEEPASSPSVPDAPASDDTEQEESVDQGETEDSANGEDAIIPEEDPEESVPSDDSEEEEEEETKKKKKMFLTTVVDWTWIVVAVVAAVVVIGGGVALWIILRKRRKQQPVTEE